MELEFIDTTIGFIIKIIGFIIKIIGFIIKMLGSAKDGLLSILPGSENITLLVIAVGFTVLFRRSELYRKGGTLLMLLIGAILFLLLKLL